MGAMRHQRIEMSETPVALSESAARRITEIVAQEAKNKLLRVSVEGGGCSGFQYRFDLVAGAEPDDLVIERSGARIVIDPISLAYMAGAEIDFVDDLIGASFKVKNPNVTAACGCGTSFSV
jgi:iron-sulfur cluster assembly accessory protein